MLEWARLLSPRTLRIHPHPLRCFVLDEAAPPPSAASLGNRYRQRARARPRHQARRRSTITTSSPPPQPAKMFAVHGVQVYPKPPPPAAAVAAPSPEKPLSKITRRRRKRNSTYRSNRQQRKLVIEPPVVSTAVLEEKATARSDSHVSTVTSVNEEIPVALSNNLFQENVANRLERRAELTAAISSICRESDADKQT